MRFLLGGLVLLFNVADNTTTFLCLRTPTDQFEVFEANPIARWLFDHLGLLQGLIFEMAVTTAAVAFLIYTPRIPRTPKLALLSVLALLPAYAALNNLQVMQLMGIV